MLIVAVFIACILGIGLGSCLVLVRFEHDSVVRSQAWNLALTVAEGGVEEALARLNPGASAASAPDGSYGPLSRGLSGGSYDVLYTTSSGSALIYATGQVAVPSLSATVSRVVQVAATNTPLFTAPLAAKGPIDLNGSSLSTDSYNSADPYLSNNGQYPGYLSGKTSTNGDVATVSGLMDTGYIHVRGDLFLGPTATSGTAGTGVVSGVVHRDFNVDFPDVAAPSTVNWTPAAPLSLSTNGITYPNAFLQGGSYTISGLSGSVYVGAGVNVTLSISGNANVGDINIAGVGYNAGKLTIYMAGPSFTVNGDTTVDSGSVSGLTYFGLPGNNSIALNGPSDFVGTIYAPGADLSIVNAGDPWWYEDFDTFHLTGAVATRSVSVNGYDRCCFHFDENLGATSSPRRGYVATAWQVLH